MKQKQLQAEAKIIPGWKCRQHGAYCTTFVCDIIEEFQIKGYKSEEEVSWKDKPYLRFIYFEKLSENLFEKLNEEPK